MSLPATDWASVDYTRPIADLMREYGVSRTTVYIHRREYAAGTIRERGPCLGLSHTEYMADYRARHPEKAKAIQAANYAANRADRLAWQRDYATRKRGGPPGKVGRPKKTG